MIEDTGLPVSVRPGTHRKGLRARREQDMPQKAQQESPEGRKGANPTLDTQRSTAARRTATLRGLRQL